MPEGVCAAGFAFRDRSGFVARFERHFVPLPGPLPGRTDQRITGGALPHSDRILEAAGKGWVQRNDAVLAPFALANFQLGRVGLEWDIRRRDIDRLADAQAGTPLQHHA